MIYELNSEMSGIEKGKHPTHIAIILDGNRRYAKRMHKNPVEGHLYGRDKVVSLLTWCQELNIRELTLYAFSMENFNRPKEEVDFLIKILKKHFEELKKDKRIFENQIKINVAGRIDLFPKEVTQKMREIMDLTKNHNRYIVNFCLAYAGRTEILDATKKIATQVKKGTLKMEDINDDIIAKNLYLSSQPDLIIRTGGEMRTSNFLLYQGAYSEWFFLEKTWPEFEKQDLINIIEEFQNRERRFGH